MQRSGIFCTEAMDRKGIQSVSLYELSLVILEMQTDSYHQWVRPYNTQFNDLEVDRPHKFLISHADGINRLFDLMKYLWAASTPFVQTVQATRIALALTSD